MRWPPSGADAPVCRSKDWMMCASPRWIIAAVSMMAVTVTEGHGEAAA